MRDCCVAKGEITVVFSLVLWVPQAELQPLRDLSLVKFEFGAGSCLNGSCLVGNARSQRSHTNGTFAYVDVCEMSAVLEKHRRQRMPSALVYSPNLIFG